MEKEKNIYFGFASFEEVLMVALGLKDKTMQLFQLLITLFGTISLFFDAYIFHPYQQYYVLISLLIADNVTGILVGLLVKKEGFSTKKCQRFILILIGYTAAMCGAFWMAQVAYFYAVLPHVVFYYLSSVLFLSNIKNLSMLQWLPHGINVFLKKFLDKQKDQLVEISKQNDITPE